jgi:protein phosphatase 1 regulatory subunit 10
MSTSTPPPQQKKEQFLLAVKPLLQPSSFTGAQAVNSLVTLIDVYGSQEVDASTRLEILTKIRDQAGNHYFRAWSENLLAIDISREWLKAAFVAKDDSPLVETIMPLLHVRQSVSFRSLQALTYFALFFSEFLSIYIDVVSVR